MISYFSLSRNSLQLKEFDLFSGWISLLNVGGFHWLQLWHQSTFSNAKKTAKKKYINSFSEVNIVTVAFAYYSIKDHKTNFLGTVGILSSQ